jgi:outer membrane biosynthesis protein TonB
VSAFIGIKRSINDSGRQGTIHRTASLAIACSIALHWAAVQWITVKTATPKPSFALNARIVGELPVNPPELNQLSEPSADIGADAPSAESLQSMTPREAANQSILNTGNVLTAPAHYFLRDEVDVPAEPTSKPKLLFPERAFMSNLSGKVRARLFINESGTVDALDIIETTPRHQPFTDSATVALKETIFIPAMIAGRKVKSQRVVEVLFNAEEDSPLP